MTFNFEKLEKALAKIDLYIEDVDGDNCVVVPAMDKKAGLVQRMIDHYDGDEGNVYIVIEDDDVYFCDRCQKWHYIRRAYESGETGVFIENQGYICLDCVEAYDDVKEDVVWDAVNNPEKDIDLDIISPEFFTSHGWKAGDYVEWCDYSTSKYKVFKHLAEKFSEIVFAYDEYGWTWFTK